MTMPAAMRFASRAGETPEEKLVHPDDGSRPHPPRMKAPSRPDPNDDDNTLTRGG